MRLAIVGSGIAGMTAAHLLEEHHEIHLFEADDRPGGHAHTVTVDLPEGQVGADTGFLVYNERTYPLFTRLLARLGVATHPSDMSFSLSDPRRGLEWRGTSLSTVFAQRRNVARPAFLAMLADVARFNRSARRLLADPESSPSGSLADFLAAHRWSRGFLDWYLIPLGSAIWSADPETFTQIPARTFAELFSRHGLLGPGHQPAWRTVTGGSTRYVQAILEPLTRRGGLHLRTGVAKVRRLPDGVELLTPNGPATFDHVIMATHSDQALALLADPTDEERRVLGAIRYQQNRATLHTDTTVLPANRRAWASWNYVRADEPKRQSTLTYYLNRLQGFDVDQPVMVTLNREGAIDPEQIVARMDYAHPIIDEAAVAVQSHQGCLSAGSVSFCGAYWGYGFHEDGVRSALAVSRRFGARL
jgi:predicted NAD/FAD-binding protein